MLNFNKRLIAISSLLIAINAFAEWIHLDDQDNGSFFYDPKSVQRIGNQRIVSELYNQVPLPDGKKLSWVMETKYDCKLKRLSIQSIQEFPNHMAVGDPKKKHDPDNKKWLYFKEGSLAYEIHKKIC